jgi:hypothetical protein
MQGDTTATSRRTPLLGSCKLLAPGRSLYIDLGALAEEDHLRAGSSVS